MTRKELEAKARIIQERLNDNPNSVGFHCKAIKVLGFQRCYELCSITLEIYRDGDIRTTPARYYNGCVLGEAESEGLKWNTSNHE